MRNDARGNVHPPLVDRFHKGDAPAGGFGLQPGNAIGRAGAKAKPAVNAAVHIRLGRRIGGAETGKDRRARQGGGIGRIRYFGVHCFGDVRSFGSRH